MCQSLATGKLSDGCKQRAYEIFRGASLATASVMVAPLDVGAQRPRAVREGQQVWQWRAFPAPRSPETETGMRQGTVSIACYPPKNIEEALDRPEWAAVVGVHRDREQGIRSADIAAVQRQRRVIEEQPAPQSLVKLPGRFTPQPLRSTVKAPGLVRVPWKIMVCPGAAVSVAKSKVTETLAVCTGLPPAGQRGRLWSG